MNTEYGPRNPERDIDKQWESEDIIETKDMNRIENLVRMLTNNVIWNDEIGDTLLRDSEPPRKINVKEMSSTAGGITPTPPTTNLDKSILFADGYNLINVSHSIDNTNNKQDFVINRSSDTSNLASFSIGAASTSNIGLMSSTDKQNLESLWSGSIPKNNSNEMTTIVTLDNFLNLLQTIQTFDSNNNGLVPKTNGASASNYLKANGTWSTINCDEVSGAVKEKTNASLNSIEFSPNSSTAGHGGYLDFHYNNSSSDYTSRIIELSSGVLTINGGTTINTSGNVTANSFSGNGASLTDLSGPNISGQIPYSSLPNTTYTDIWINSDPNSGLYAPDGGTYFSWTSPTITGKPKYLVMTLIDNTNLAYLFGYVIFPYDGTERNFWFFNNTINLWWDTTDLLRGMYYGFTSSRGYCCRRFGGVAVTVGGGYSDMNYYGTGYLNGTTSNRYCVPYKLTIVC